jgi:PKD repeat protein
MTMTKKTGMLAALVLMAWGCNSDKQMGTEGGPCFEDKTCKTGLTCLSNVCVQVVTDGPVKAPDMKAGDGPAKPDGARPDGAKLDGARHDIPKLPDSSKPKYDGPLPDKKVLADACVAVDSGMAAQITVGTVSPQAFCPGATVQVPYTATGSFKCGNLFTAQLSSSTGSFTTFTNIGTATSMTGTITATIPAAAAAGTKYRVRVISGAPYVISPDSTDLAVHALPTATFGCTPTMTVNDGALVTCTPTVSTNATYDWAFGAGASPATSTQVLPKVTYLTAGLKTISLTTTNTQGCTATATSTDSVNVYNCKPVIPSSAAVVKTTTTGTANAVWICPGGAYTTTPGGISVFVEAGGAFNGGYYPNTVYVKSGGVAALGIAGMSVVVREAGATVSGSFILATLTCSTLSFDYSQAPANGCQP